MRRPRRRLTGGLLVPLLLVALSPYIAAVQPFRDMVLRAVLPEINGTISSGGASLGWFSPIEFRDIRISSPDGTPVVVVASIRGDMSMWRYLISGRDLGTVRMEKPQLSVVVLEEGSNLSQLVVEQPTEPDQPASPPDVSLGLEIVDGSLTFLSRKAQEPWNLQGFNLALALRSSAAAASGQPELVLHQGTVFDRAPITPQMCDDLLKYIAPVLAEVTDVSGEFSIELDEWRLPLEDLQKGEGSGRLTIHTIDLEAGPLVRALTTLLGLPPSVRLADNSVVEFTMREGRVHHRDLQFGIGKFQVRTEGSVGVDQTLDLLAEVPIPDTLLGFGLVENTALFEAMQGQTLRLPVHGTLDEPKVDALKLGASNSELLQSLLGGLLEKRSGEEGDLLDLLRGLEPSGETPLLDRLREEPLLDRLREEPLLDRLRRDPVLDRPGHPEQEQSPPQPTDL
jgi:hypothetical protein